MSLAIIRLAALFSFVASLTASAQTFVCSSTPKPDTTQLTAATLYTPTKAGFDLQMSPTTFDGACSSDKPFFFSVPADDGNYKVTVTLGGDRDSITTLRAESRRLLLMEQKVPAGKSESFSFTLNVRTPEIAGKSAKVKLKPREIGALDWDDKLTLEFNGEHPSVRSITIAPAASTPTLLGSIIPTLYLAGDSTVVDQDKEPWAAWGQMLPYFFTNRIAISNQAESGETIKSFIGENRLEKIASTIKAGDYLMVQFAHNDQKPGPGYVPAATDYKDYLLQYIELARDKGAFLIVVTSMNRRTFDSSGHITDSLAPYPAAAREFAATEHIPVIDLNAMSKTLYEAMGPDGTLKAFVHYPANTFPGQPDELKDDTHFNAYGAYELARCVVQSIEAQHLPLASYLRKHIPPFNPAQPDSLATWHLPASPAISTDTPYGR